MEVYDLPRVTSVPQSYRGRFLHASFYIPKEWFYSKALKFLTLCKLKIAVADPGFLRRRRANPRGGGASLLFGQNVPENCIKMTEIGPGAHVLGAPLDTTVDRFRCI